MEKRNRWNERYASKELLWSAGPNELFADLIGELKPGKALDVATGEGRNALWLAEQGWDVDAIDFSNVAIEKGKQVAEARKVAVNWIVDDVSSFGFDLGHYDLVAVLYLHTSKEERSVWLGRTIEAVKPGGSFIYIAHDPSNVELGVGGPQDVSLLPSVEELRGYLSEFELQRMEIHERAVESDPGHGGSLTGVALDTLVWAVRK
ncbi:MAG: class I SAM-dependent methyltransferase [Gammaproteobacteria bacterium]|jgi:SAM-dependent methyltransferase|nr:class I SAM-dependent methyltransferase [Gammaproteobacteria bacterium]MBT7371271.1 class I SAM-dependent methyltransferase [Gammaproteobacteria bacterium]